MRITVPNVPVESLRAMAEELELFGPKVAFEESGTRGHISCTSGALQFDHTDGALTVVLLENNHHFPDRMLLGGIRQFVEEAVYAFQKAKAA